MKFNVEQPFRNLSGIYIIKNNIDDRVYIGSAYDLWHRYKNHINNLVKNKHHAKPLQNFANKYGIETLSFNLIELCDKIELITKEQYWMDYYSATMKFNVRLIAGNNGGFKHSAETKLKLSIAHMGKPGHKPTLEQIEIVRKKNTGLKRTEEFRKECSIRHKGKKCPEVGQRMRDLLKGKKQSEEHVKKRTSQRIGTKQSEESKLKNRLTQLGRKQDPEWAKHRVMLSLEARRKNKEERLQNQLKLFANQQAHSS